MAEHKCNCGNPDCLIKFNLEWNQCYDGIEDKKGPICLFTGKDGVDHLMYLDGKGLKALIDDLMEGLLNLGGVDYESKK